MSEIHCILEWGVKQYKNKPKNDNIKDILHLCVHTMNTCEQKDYLHVCALVCALWYAKKSKHMCFPLHKANIHFLPTSSISNTDRTDNRTTVLHSLKINENSQRASMAGECVYRNMYITEPHAVPGKDSLRMGKISNFHKTIPLFFFEVLFFFLIGTIFLRWTNGL